MEEAKKEICLSLLGLFELAKAAPEPQRGQIAVGVLNLLNKVEAL